MTCSRPKLQDRARGDGTRWCSGGRLLYGFVATLMILHGLMLAWGDYRHSPTWDEVAYLPAGISHWQLGNYDLYRANPPLVRLLAAVPVILAAPKTDWSGSGNEWRVGHDFLRANGERSFWLFTLARWVCIPFSLLGAYVCFRWARELYGTMAGMLALALWCFSPNIIAHGQLITPDVGTTALGVAAAYAFWRWLKGPSWGRASLAGLTLGLAELAKGTWIVLFLLWPLIWVVWRWPCSKDQAGRRKAGFGWRREGCQLAIILVLAVYLINLCYGFEGSFQDLGDYEFVRRAFGDHEHRAEPEGQMRGNFAATWLSQVPVPLPENYLRGAGAQKKNFGRKQWSYLRGEWQKGGRWYYYGYGLGIKVPLGTWILVVTALMVGVFLPGYCGTWRDELVLLAPLIIVFTLVSSQTGFNRHLRYVMPILPFAFIWTSKVARAVDLNRRRIVLLGTVALLWSVASSLWVYPHSLSYFNGLVGGPTGGADHLSASNTDWGQDLLYLKRWLEEHPEARPFGLAFDGGYPPSAVGMDFSPPPEGPGPEPEASQDPDQVGPKPGWYAVSVNIMRWRSKEYAYFLRFDPVATIGYSMNVYHITPDEANRVRRDLKLPNLPPARAAINSQDISHERVGDPSRSNGPESSTIR